MHTFFPLVTCQSHHLSLRPLLLLTFTFRSFLAMMKHVVTGATVQGQTHTFIPQMQTSTYPDAINPLAPLPSPPLPSTPSFSPPLTLPPTSLPLPSLPLPSLLLL